MSAQTPGLASLIARPIFLLMNLAVLVIFLLVGVINLLPAIGVFSPEQIHRLYHVSVDGDLAVLMRHRALLLGLIGLLMIVGAFAADVRVAAGMVGFLSMVSFVALSLPLDQLGPSLRRIAIIDIGASILIAFGLALHWVSNAGGEP